MVDRLATSDDQRSLEGRLDFRNHRTNDGPIAPTATISGAATGDARLPPATPARSIPADVRGGGGAASELLELFRSDSSPPPSGSPEGGAWTVRGVADESAGRGVLELFRATSGGR